MLELLLNASALFSGIVFGWGMVIRGVEKGWPFFKIALTALALYLAVCYVGIVVPPLVYYLLL
jgi:hypothetical protein